MSSVLSRPLVIGLPPPLRELPGWALGRTLEAQPAFCSHLNLVITDQLGCYLGKAGFLHRADYCLFILLLGINSRTPSQVSHYYLCLFIMNTFSIATGSASVFFHSATHPQCDNMTFMLFSLCSHRQILINKKRGTRLHGNNCIFFSAFSSSFPKLVPCAESMPWDFIVAL